MLPKPFVDVVDSSVLPVVKYVSMDSISPASVVLPCSGDAESGPGVVVVEYGSYTGETVDSVSGVSTGTGAVSGAVEVSRGTVDLVNPPATQNSMVSVTAVGSIVVAGTVIYTFISI